MYNNSADDNIQLVLEEAKQSIYRQHTRRIVLISITIIFILLSVIAYILFVDAVKDYYKYFVGSIYTQLEAMHQRQSQTVIYNKIQTQVTKRPQTDPESFTTGIKLNDVTPKTLVQQLMQYTPPTRTTNVLFFIDDFESYIEVRLPKNLRFITNYQTCAMTVDTRYFMTIQIAKAEHKESVPSLNLSDDQIMAGLVYGSQFYARQYIPIGDYVFVFDSMCIYKDYNNVLYALNNATIKTPNTPVKQYHQTTQFTKTFDTTYLKQYDTILREAKATVRSSYPSTILIGDSYINLLPVTTQDKSTVIKSVDNMLQNTAYSTSITTYTDLHSNRLSYYAETETVGCAVLYIDNSYIIIFPTDLSGKMTIKEFAGRIFYEDNQTKQKGSEKQE